MKTIDIVVLILTIAVASVMLGSLFIPLVTNEPLTDVKAKILAGIITSVIAIISLYVGSKLNTNWYKDEEKDD